MAEEEEVGQSQLQKNEQWRRQMALQEEYRKLIEHTEKTKEALERPDDDGLQRGLKTANEHFELVKNQKAIELDANYLRKNTEIAKKKAENIHTNFSTMTPESFIAKLSTNEKYLQRGTNRTHEIDWAAIGREATKTWSLSASFSVMLGPLSVERKAPKERKKAERQKVEKVAAVRPDLIEKDDYHTTDKEITARVAEIYEIINKEDPPVPMDVFQLTTNPLSFGQTVENLFHFSFLVKDGKAQIYPENGRLKMVARLPPDQESLKANPKKAFTLAFDMWDYKRNIIDMDIQESTIPHRKPGQHPGQPPTQSQAPQTQQPTSSTGRKRGRQATQAEDEDEEIQAEPESDGSEELSHKRKKKRMS